MSDDIRNSSALHHALVMLDRLLQAAPESVELRCLTDGHVDTLRSLLDDFGCA